MPITKEAKKELVSQFAKTEGDTGSSQVQCALFTGNIKNLTEHLKVNKKDYQARRGLMALVMKRKRLLLYLKRVSTDQYEDLIRKLELKSV